MKEGDTEDFGQFFDAKSNLEYTQYLESPNFPDVGEYHLPNIPILHTRLPQEEMKYLWSMIEKASKDVRHTLAGNITSSLALDDRTNRLYNLLEPICLSYYTHVHDKCFGAKPFTINIADREITGIKMDSLWVNFQKETEFNPVHDHTGVFSFVIWMKIPTECEDQHNLPICKSSNSPQASDFNFQYIDILGGLKHLGIPMGSQMEGVMVIFPSVLQHYVHPFYECKDTRISISGNLAFVTSETDKKMVS